jgi:hypothetical protein
MDDIKSIMLRRLELANAKLDGEIKRLDIDLKKFELQNKPSFLKSVVINAAVFAALIAVFAAAGTTYVSSRIAQQQRELERERNQMQIALERDKHENELLSRILSTPKFWEEPCISAATISYYLGAHVFTRGDHRDILQESSASSEKTHKPASKDADPTSPAFLQAAGRDGYSAGLGLARDDFVPFTAAAWLHLAAGELLEAGDDSCGWKARCRRG